MPLYKNTNQPYFPDPNSPASMTCNGSYCYPVNQGDYFYSQWYQTPCGSNEIADPNFDNVTYGPEMVTNGDFSLPFAPDWTALDWTLVAGQAQGPISSFANDLRQTLAFTGSIAFYRLQVTVSGLSPGDYVDVYVGNLSAWYRIDQNGTFDEIVRSGTDFDLIFVAGDNNLANVLLDNISLTTVTFGDWLLNGTWTLQLGEGMACADASGTGLLEEDVVDYIVIGSYYKLSYTVSGYVAGDVTPYIANMPGTAVTANGDYEVYLTPTATGVVSFLPSADFEGCISALNLVELRNDYLFEVISDNGTRYDVSSWVEYHEDKVTLASPILDLLELPYACYTVEVTDRCLVEGIELVTNGDFAAGYDDWTRNNGYDQYNLNAGVMELVFEPLENGDLMTNGDFSAGAAGWTAVGWTIGTGATHNTGNVSALSRSVTIGTPAVPPSVRVTWVQFTMSGRTAGSVTVTVSDVTSAAYSTNEIITFPLAPTIGGAVTISITPTSDFDGTVDDIQVYQSLRPWSSFVILTNTANPDMVAGNYALEYDLVSNSSVGTLGAIAITLSGQTQSASYDTTVATHTRSITGYTPGGQFMGIVARFRVGNNYYPGRIGIDNMSAVRVEPFEATYTSDCLNYQSVHEDTYLLTGECDQESFGFDFVNTGFLLQMRAEIRGLNPIYNKSKNIATYGNGNSQLNYAESTKKWQLVTGFMSESAHDALSTIIDCDHFWIGNPDADGIEYIAELDDYTPAWIPSGSYALAPVTITLSLKEDGTKFNRHI